MMRKGRVAVPLRRSRMGPWSLSARPVLRLIRASRSTEHQQEDEDRFTRYVDRSSGAAALQTRTVRLCRGPEQEKLEVDIVATVHIGDESYYKKLCEELQGYDRVLYEMVADTSKIDQESGRFKPEHPKKSTSLVGLTQRSLASLLKLQFQLEHMDYTADSWYHADLDIKEFDRLQKETGESLLSFSRTMSKTALDSFWKKQNDVDAASWQRFLRQVQFFVPMPLIAQVLLSTLLSRATDDKAPKSPAFYDLLEFNYSSALKRTLGKQLSLLGESGELASKGAASSVLIGARNAAAVEQVAAAASEGCQKVALLYGAAHSPDLERRLGEELGLYRAPSNEADWLDAWSIAAPNSEIGNRQSPILRYFALLFISFIMATDLCLWESIVNHVHGIITSM